MKRKDHEPPAAVALWGWRYHHCGIPTSERRPGETYLEFAGVGTSGFETSPFGIEWMRFEKGSPVADLVQKVPHVAFEVDDIEAELARLKIEAEITVPSPGVRVAMIVHDGAPIELIEFRKPRRKK